MPAPTSQRLLTPILVAYLAIAAGLLWLCDDAYISFRYSRHLAEGHGLLFNLGETPPIEGYSNLLWVLATAVGELVGLGAPLVAGALGLVGAGVWALVTGRWYLERAGERPAAGLAALVLVLSLPTAVVWATGGLGTSCYAAALLLTFRWLLASEPRPVAASWALAAAMLLRVNGFAQVVLVLGLATLLALGGGRGRLRQLAWPWVAFGLALGGQTVFRRLYHGHWLPHTAMVKVTTQDLDPLRQGLQYVGFLAATMPVLGLALAWAALRWLGSLPRGVAGLLPGRDLDRGAFELVAAGVLGLGITAQAVLVGGDFMAYGRFLVPALPFLGLFLVEPLARLRPTSGWLAAGALSLTSLLVLGGVRLTPMALLEPLDYRWGRPTTGTEHEAWLSLKETAAAWSEFGRALAAHTEPGETIVLGTVGAIGYHSELFILDTYGLVSREVGLRDEAVVEALPGHKKAVADTFFLDRDPDYFTYTYLVPAETPWYGVPEAWRDNEIFQGLFEVEFHPTDGIEGVRPGQVLRLVRRVSTLDEVLAR